MEKTVNFKVDEKLYREMKIYIAKEGITLKNYVIGLIRRDLGKAEK